MLQLFKMSKSSTFFAARLRQRLWRAKGGFLLRKLKMIRHSSFFS